MSKRGARPWYLYALAVVAVALAILGVAEIGPPTSSARTSTQIVTAENGVVQSTVTGTGNIAAGADLNVNFQTSGTLSSVTVIQGQHVNKGQLLASLDSTSAQLTLDQAEQNLTAAEDQLSTAESNTSSTTSSSTTTAGLNTSAGSGTTQFVSDTTNVPASTTTTPAAKPPPRRQLSPPPPPPPPPHQVDHRLADDDQRVQPFDGSAVGRRWLGGSGLRRDRLHQQQQLHIPRRGRSHPRRRRCTARRRASTALRPRSPTPSSTRRSAARSCRSRA